MSAHRYGRVVVSTNFMVAAVVVVGMAVGDTSDRFLYCSGCYQHSSGWLHMVHVVIVIVELAASVLMYVIPKD